MFSVYSILKDKTDFNIIYIGAMHGEHEKKESLRQIAIQKLYGTDKLFEYLRKFDTNTDIGNCGGSDSCLNSYLNTIYDNLGISKIKVEDYMNNFAEEIYQENLNKAESLGVAASPTFFINGYEVSVMRSPEEIKKSICERFINAPKECRYTLATTIPIPGFSEYSGDSSGGGGGGGGGAVCSTKPTASYENKNLSEKIKSTKKVYDEICRPGNNEGCFFKVDLSDYNGQDIEYYFLIQDIAGNIVKSKINKVLVDTKAPKIKNPLDFFEVSGNYVYFKIEIEETNLAKIEYKDYNEKIPKWKSLCSKLNKYGFCTKKVSFKGYYPELSIKVSDKAGNAIEKNIGFQD
jgi:hypothetical protein